MNWFVTIICEILGTLIYLCIIFPLGLFIYLFITFLMVMCLPLKIDVINKYVMKRLSNSKDK